MNFSTTVRRVLGFSFLIFVSSIFVIGQESIYRLPKGTQITLEMDVELSSAVASKDDTFIARTTKPIIIRDVVVLPKGIEVEGRVVTSKRPGLGGRDGELTFVIETLKVGNDIRRGLETTTVTRFKPESRRALDIASLAGGTVVGALIGFAAKSSQGAIVGAAIGAGVGGGTLAVRKGRDITIKKGQQFVVELNKEVVLPVFDF